MGCSNCNQTNITGNCNCSDPIALPIGPGGPQGPTGSDGSDGADGDDGRNAFTTTKASFVQPAVGSLGATKTDPPTNPVTITVDDVSPFTGEWASWGQIIWILGGGYYLVHSATADTMVVVNLAYLGNATAGVTIASGANVSPAGIRGLTGGTGSVGSTGAPGTNGADGDTPTYLGAYSRPPSSPNNLDFYRNTRAGALYFYDATSATWNLMAMDGSTGGVNATNVGSGGSSITVNSSSERQQILKSTGTVTLAGDVTIALGTGVFVAGHTLTVIYNANLIQAGGTVTILGVALTDAQALIGDCKIVSTYDGSVWHTQLFETYTCPQPLIYKAYLNQTGTNIPVATEIINTVGSVVYSYNAVGDYTGTLTGAFPAAKTFIMYKSTMDTGTGNIDYIVNIYRVDDDSFHIGTWETTGGTAANGVLTDTYLSIEVYP